MSDMIKDNEIQLENEEELDTLVFSGKNDLPIFESVRVTKKDFSVYELYRKYKKGQLILDVDFQRRKVWEPKQKSELIESILMGLPLPIFYFKQQTNSDYVVVDGKQRLSTLFDYLNNEFALKNLNILPFLNGMKFKNLEDEYGIYQSQLEDYQVYSHVILPPTPDVIIFDIFDRVNRGGTKLNKQEIRNALYHGRGLELIDDITRTDEFEMVTRIQYRKDTRMKGSYLMSRFISFYMFFNRLLGDYEYSGDLDQLIEITLRNLNNSSEEFLNDLKRISIDCLHLSYVIYGSNAFRRELKSSHPINMNIFETTMYFMSLIRGKKVNLNKVKQLLTKMIKSNEFLGTIGNGRDNAINVKSRFEMIDLLSREVIDD